MSWVLSRNEHQGSVAGLEGLEGAQETEQRYPAMSVRFYTEPAAGAEPTNDLLYDSKDSREIENGSFSFNRLR